MIHISSVEARRRFGEVVNRAAFDDKRIILTRRGKAVAAIVPIEDVEWLEELEAIQDRIDIEDAKAALAEAREHGTFSWEEMKAKLGH